MGFYSNKTNLVLARSTSLNEFMIKNMFFLARSFWGSLWSYILHVFSIISTYFLRFSWEKTVEIGYDLDVVSEKIDDGINDTNGYEEKDYDQTEEKEIIEDDSEVGSVSNASASKYEFFAGNSVCAFIEEPQTMSFTVQEMFVVSHDESFPRQDSVEKDCSLVEVDSSGFSVDVNDNSFSQDVVVAPNSVKNDDCDELDELEEVVSQGKTESPVCVFTFEEQETSGMIEDELCEEEKSDFKQEASVMIEDELCEEEKSVNLEDGIFKKLEASSDQVHPSVEDSNDFWASIHKYDYFLGSSDRCDSDSDEILSDKSSVESLEPEISMCMGDEMADYNDNSPGLSGDAPFDHYQSNDVNVESEHGDVDSSYVELDPQSYNSIDHAEEYVPRDEFSDSDDDDFDQEDATFGTLKGIDASESCHEGDDQMGEDVLLEQKELIRRMKKEMRQVKISGLPTILEESESPRVEDDLRPLRIDERIGHKERMDEIQTFYRMYLDKMKKLDILSQQTMYAIGLLQLKNQDQLALNKKVSVPMMKSLLSQNFWCNKLRKHETDPVQKLIRDLRSKLEVVYVGQLCLSWEILKWQHHNAKDLQTLDPERFRQYNQVAGEYQKFQVLLQRFTEDEPFHQGPRVQHYLKSRCGNPNLIQVPLMKDDPRSEWKEDGEGAISISMLKAVVSASMRSFWEFLRADKDEVHALTLMGIHTVQVDLQDPSYADLLSEIRSSLLKKEKRLKDLVRSGNCLVRKFQKHQDKRLSQEMFLAQVELRLVSRVLSMSKLTTDQLLWCHKKISKINIIGRKVYLESSILLFPC